MTRQKEKGRPNGGWLAGGTSSEAGEATPQLQLGIDLDTPEDIHSRQAFVTATTQDEQQRANETETYAASEGTHEESGNGRGLRNLCALSCSRDKTRTSECRAASGMRAPRFCVSTCAVLTSSTSLASACICQRGKGRAVTLR